MTDTHERTVQTTAEPPQPFRLDLGEPDFAERAFDRYAALRAACPVHRALFANSAGGDQLAAYVDRPLWAVTGYDAVAAAMLDDRLSIDPRAVLSPEELAKIPGFEEEFLPLFRNLLSLDPPKHTRLRKLVQPSFTARAVEAWRPRIERIAGDLLDAAERAAAERGEVAPERTMELIAAFAFPLPITVIFELLGIPASDRERVHVWTEALLQAGAGADEAQRASLRAFIAYGRELVAAKRARPADDLLTELTRAEEDGDRLDADELVSMIFLLVLAGHVTTVNLIANATFALLTHPAELAKLRANPALVDGAVEETLRYWGPVEQASERYPKNNVEVAGVAIGRGEMVVPILGAAGRDPARFPDPDRFDIARPEAHRHMAFGKGIHVCLGAPLARLEGADRARDALRPLPRPPAGGRAGGDRLAGEPAARREGAAVAVLERPPKAVGFVAITGRRGAMPTNPASETDCQARAQRAQDNLKMMHVYFDGLFGKDLDRLLGLFDDDIEWLIVPTGDVIRGRSQLALLARNHWAASPNRIKTLVNLFASEEFACLEYRTAGTLTDRANFPSLSFQPTGQRYEFLCCFVFHFTNGKIDRVHEYFDMETVKRQLGAAEAG